jgi:O-antigen/teichoic acid export membrane protein
MQSYKASCVTFGAMLGKIQEWMGLLTGSKQSGELARGSALLFTAKVFGALSAYLFAWLVAKRGGANAVGIYELAFTFIILLSVVTRFGLDGAIVRYIGVYNAAKLPGAVKWLYGKSISFSLVFALLLGGSLILLSPLLADFFSKPTLTQPLRWAAVSIPLFTLLNMNAETLRGYRKMVAYSLLQQGSVIFLAVIIFVFWWDENNVGLSAVIAFFLACAILYFYSQWRMQVQLAQLPARVIPGDSFRRILNVAWPIFLSSSIFMLMSWTDTLMIGYFMEESDVGIYRIAFRISTVITFTQFAINGIAAPMIAAHYHNKDIRGLRNLIHKISLFNFVLSVPIFIIIIFFPGFLLGLFGEEFMQATRLLRILSFGQVVFALSGPVMYILTMTKHEKTAVYIMLVTAGINLVGNAVLIPLIGLKGAALATASTTVLWNIIAVLSVFRYLGVVSMPFIHRFIEKPLKD